MTSISPYSPPGSDAARTSAPNQAAGHAPRTFPKRARNSIFPYRNERLPRDLTPPVSHMRLPSASLRARPRRCKTPSFTYARSGEGTIVSHHWLCPLSISDHASGSSPASKPSSHASVHVTPSGCAASTVAGAAAAAHAAAAKAARFNADATAGANPFLVFSAFSMQFSIPANFLANSPARSQRLNFSRRLDYILSARGQSRLTCLHRAWTYKGTFANRAASAGLAGRTLARSVRHARHFPRLPVRDVSRFIVGASDGACLRHPPPP